MNTTTPEPFGSKLIAPLLVVIILDADKLPATDKVLPDPIFKPMLVPVPSDLKIASRASKSALREIPQVSSAAPGSGLVKFKLVVYVSAF